MSQNVISYKPQNPEGFLVHIYKIVVGSVSVLCETKCKN